MGRLDFLGGGLSFQNFPVRQSGVIKQKSESYKIGSWAASPVDKDAAFKISYSSSCGVFAIVLSLNKFNV